MTDGEDDEFYFPYPRFIRVPNNSPLDSHCFDLKNKLTVSPQLLRKYESTIGNDLLTEKELDTIKAYKRWMRGEF